MHQGLRTLDKGHLVHITGSVPDDLLRQVVDLAAVAKHKAAVAQHTGGNLGDRASVGSHAHEGLSGDELRVVRLNHRGHLGHALGEHLIERLRGNMAVAVDIDHIIRDLLHRTHGIESPGLANEVAVVVAGTLKGLSHELIDIHALGVDCAGVLNTLASVDLFAAVDAINHILCVRRGDSEAAQGGLSVLGIVVEHVALTSQTVALAHHRIVTPSHKLGDQRIGAIVSKLGLEAVDQVTEDEAKVRNNTLDPGGLGGVKSFKTLDRLLRHHLGEPLIDVDEAVLLTGKARGIALELGAELRVILDVPGLIFGKGLVQALEGIRIDKARQAVPDLVKHRPAQLATRQRLRAKLDHTRGILERASPACADADLGHRCIDHTVAQTLQELVNMLNIAGVDLVKAGETVHHSLTHAADKGHRTDGGKIACRQIGSTLGIDCKHLVGLTIAELSQRAACIRGIVGEEERAGSLVTAGSLSRSFSQGRLALRLGGLTSLSGGLTLPPLVLAHHAEVLVIRHARLLQLIAEVALGGQHGTGAVELTARHAGQLVEAGDHDLVRLNAATDAVPQHPLGVEQPKAILLRMLGIHGQSGTIGLRCELQGLRRDDEGATFSRITRQPRNAFLAGSF